MPRTPLFKHRLLQLLPSVARLFSWSPLLFLLVMSEPTHRPHARLPLHKMLYFFRMWLLCIVHSLLLLHPPTPQRLLRVVLGGEQSGLTLQHGHKQAGSSRQVGTTVHLKKFKMISWFSIEKLTIIFFSRMFINNCKRQQIPIIINILNR